MHNFSNNYLSSVENLEEMLSRPTDYLTEIMADLDGDLIILGAGGKMGPSLSRMAKRASSIAGKDRKVIAVSRFSREEEKEKLESFEVETISCDLLESDALNKLPEAANVVFMAGMKFGSSENQAMTWAMNTYLPGNVAKKYKNSKIAVFSSGNMYGLVPITGGGAIETSEPNPSGEYAISVLGRERVFEYFSRTFNIPTSIIRLNYACELRYGVLVDIAKKVYDEQPIDLAMGNANVIWQGDANAMALASLKYASAPPFIINIAGPEILSVKRTAEYFANLFGKEVILEGEESHDALLTNAQLSHKLFGYPQTAIQNLMISIADWIKQGGENLGKPTHFETRSGKF